MSAIYILWLRQVKRYTRSRPRIIGMMMQPLLYLVALGFGFGPVYEKAGGGSYITFLAAGVIAQSVLFVAAFTGVELIFDRQIGFLKETLVAPVPRWQIMVGRTLGGATVSSFQGVLAFVLALIMGFRPVNWATVPLALFFIFLIAMLFTSLGTAFGSRLKDMQGFQLIMNFIIMPVFFLSGSLFPLDGLPKGLSIATSFNPLSYGVDGMRGVFTGHSHYGMGMDFLVLGSVTLVF